MVQVNETTEKNFPLACSPLLFPSMNYILIIFNVLNYILIIFNVFFLGSELNDSTSSNNSHHCSMDEVLQLLRQVSFFLKDKDFKFISD